MNKINTKIRNPKRYLGMFNKDEDIYISTPFTEISSDRLDELGFTANRNIGEEILPAPIGPVSEFNANGKYIAQKHLPMEIAYRLALWHWKDWGGHLHSKFVDIPYDRYPRIFVEPPSFELRISEYSSGKVILSPLFKNNEQNFKALKHCVNLFVELFGSCQIIKKDLSIPLKEIRSIKLNWEILPPGKYPWEILRVRIAKTMESQPVGNHPIILHRFQALYDLKPDFEAAGRGGFNGYVILGYERLGIYILESIYNNNATYVLNKNWEELSKLTKRELLSENLHSARIVHNANWDQQVLNLFSIRA